MTINSKGSVIIALIFMWVSLSGDFFQNRANGSDMILLPDGYVGWVRIDYNIKGAKALPHKKGGDLYVIPPSGYMRTSSPPPEGEVSEDFQYSRGGVKTPLSGLTTIWDEGIGGPAGPNDGAFSQRTFFVGTQTQWELADQVHAPVRRIPLAAFSAWSHGRDLSNRSTPKSNFMRAKLAGANFWNSSFKGSNFQKADLSYAAMGADFTGANFRGATLYGADLNETILVHTDLRDCDLRGALLQGADLTGARMQGANLKSAEYDSHTKWPRGFDARKQGALVSPLTPLQ